MKRHLFLLFCALFFSACKAEREPKEDKLRQWMSDNGKKKILCTTAMVSSLVERVGGTAIECLTLIQGEHDPHSYQLVKGDDEKIARADLIFFSGLGLEHGPSLAYHLQNSSKAYSLGAYILKTAPQNIIYIDNTIDPHVWMDVSLWSQTIPSIVETLNTLLPECKDDIKNNAKVLIAEMKNVHEMLKNELHSIPKERRYLVTTHDAFNYFTRAYLAEDEEVRDGTWRTRFQAPEGLAPDSQLSTLDIHRLAEYIMQHGVRSIFSESNVSRDSLKKLVDACKEKGYVTTIAKEPLYADALGPFKAAGSYLMMMEYDAQVIVRGLKE